MIMEDVGPIKSAPAVIPTNPARIPFNTIVISGFLRTVQEVSIAPTAPADAASDVVTNTRDTNPDERILREYEEEFERRFGR